MMDELTREFVARHVLFYDTTDTYSEDFMFYLFVVRDELPYISLIARFSHFSSPLLASHNYHRSLCILVRYDTVWLS